MKNEELHSEEFFCESRNHWWNDDYVELVSKRLKLNQYFDILDVGCGLGHWFRVLAPYLNKKANYTGIDQEKTWVEKSEIENKKAFSLKSMSYLKADAHKLPFGDNTFDFVTCQTVLIHLKDPEVALKEILRVLKPGGLLLAVEPNNFSNMSTFDSLTDTSKIDEILTMLKDQLIIQNGKKSLGEGFNSLGDFVPGFMKKVGFKNIKVSISDKAVSWIPPYDTPEGKLRIKELKDQVATSSLGWKKEDVKRYYFEGGGTKEGFKNFVESALQENVKVLESINNKTYSSSGGVMQYLISGYKKG